MSTAPLLSPEEILTRQSMQAERIRLADPASVFGDRATRLRQLAAGHVMRDFLLFMADVAQAQQKALNMACPLPLPTQKQLDAAASLGQPPLAPERWPLDEDWQVDLHSLLGTLLAQMSNASVRSALEHLKQMAPVQRQQQAERLLSANLFGLNLAAAPLLGAALQVHFTRLVAQTAATYPGRAFAPVDDGRICPCCGSAPVASVRRPDSLGGSSRYLHCALCQTEWHMVRIKCAHCESTKGIHYEALERTGDAPAPTVPVPQGAVQAECCDECGHYLKIMAMDKDPYLDPVADDLGTVALDLLVSETGMQRHGVNYLLLWGEPADAASDDASASCATP